MSRLSNQIIEIESEFWDKAGTLIGSCSNFALYNSAIMSIAPNFLTNSPNAIVELQEQLEEGWNEFWGGKNA
jgi:hypothetical protein|tara:strand:- start:1064 stop:1279 length:216 start_codon:yes stop_codon:yes gene_type:complete